MVVYAYAHRKTCAGKHHWVELHDTLQDKHDAGRPFQGRAGVAIVALATG